MIPPFPKTSESGNPQGWLEWKNRFSPWALAELKASDRVYQNLLLLLSRDERISFFQAEAAVSGKLLSSMLYVNSRLSLIQTMNFRRTIFLRSTVKQLQILNDSITLLSDRLNPVQIPPLIKLNHEFEVIGQDPFRALDRKQILEAFEHAKPHLYPNVRESAKP